MTETIREQFFAWQCRIRQLSVRKHNGKPQPGMMPSFTGVDGTAIIENITVLIVHNDPKASTSEFRHIVTRTHDPQKRVDDAIKLVSTLHYQYPNEFSDQMTALFSEGSGIAASLLKEGAGRLEFSQFGQSFSIPCTVSELKKDVPAWQATFWHNHMFNPHISESSIILSFSPDWAGAAYTSAGD
ncbi:MAG: hypothetical protein HOE62_17520 [Alphaproteobacteria bacterium]|nr:hypothetical protein [Alphaproteobacteria bacterium]MBT4464545.1 hypothetical protein [Rhodospirillaceae bacterium]